ncbi:MAG TPA: MaoC family dehydratase [Dehalococcoidia bacterium]|nr:MaoC family dehydratase [Dehalococcoidia bacterium]
MQTLASLDKGHEFPPVEFELNPKWVAGYVAATCDETTGTVCPEAVPPMALAAVSIRALLDSAKLPAGAIHVGQELAFYRMVRAGERLSIHARIVSRGERAGWVLLAVDVAVESGGDNVMSGRSVVTFPAGDSGG